MANTLIVYVHPAQRSYNRAILDRLLVALASRGDRVDLCDLHAERFDPLMTEDELYEGPTPTDVQRAQARVLAAERLYFVYPTWWWTPPAMLKGWLERVICLGFAFRYDIASRGYVGLLTGRSAVIVSTGSSDPAVYESDWQRGAHRDFVAEVLKVAGIQVTRHLALTNVHRYAAGADLRGGLEAVASLAGQEPSA